MSDRANLIKLLRNGNYPSQIAGETGETIVTVLRRLQSAAGHGEIRLSEIYFSWPETKRALMQELSDDSTPDAATVEQNELTLEELELFIELRSTLTFNADMYHYVSELELGLHDLVSSCLMREFGEEDSGWWRQGINEKIRQSCAMRREGDEDPADHPFSYTTLIDLYNIIANNWGNLFVEEVPDYYRNSKPILSSNFSRLNRIRNAIMHPVKRRKLREDDFEFVRGMYDRFLSHRTTASS
jgi:hypothetical protein